MTKNIPLALIDIQTKLVEKLEAQPYLDTSMSITQEGKFKIRLYSEHSIDIIFSACGDSAEVSIDLALAYIDSMPQKESQRIAKWQKDLAHVIDEGHDLNLPDNVLDPLRSSSQAMTENLLGVVK